MKPALAIKAATDKEPAELYFQPEGPFKMYSTEDLHWNAKGIADVLRKGRSPRGSLLTDGDKRSLNRQLIQIDEELARRENHA